MCVFGSTGSSYSGNELKAHFGIQSKNASARHKKIDCFKSMNLKHFFCFLIRRLFIIFKWADLIEMRPWRIL